MNYHVADISHAWMLLHIILTKMWYCLKLWYFSLFFKDYWDHYIKNCKSQTRIIQWKWFEVFTNYFFMFSFLDFVAKFDIMVDSEEHMRSMIAQWPLVFVVIAFIHANSVLYYHTLVSQTIQFVVPYCFWLHVWNSLLLSSHPALLFNAYFSVATMFYNK